MIIGFISDFTKLSRNDVALAGGKGASLGEMTRAKIPVPPGFVILSTAFEKFMDGDILITIQSNPSLMPVIVKSSAIVADEGGIMSHAAIVSRELGKPCIIGTKIATKILKDGDKIEVDAMRGIVKILR